MGKLLFTPNMFYLQYYHFVVVAVSVTIPFSVKGFIDKVFGFDIIFIKLSTFQCKTCLPESDIAFSVKTGLSPVSAILSVSRPDLEPHTLWMALFSSPRNDSVRVSHFFMNSYVYLSGRMNMNATVFPHNTPVPPHEAVIVLNFSFVPAVTSIHYFPMASIMLSAN